MKKILLTIILLIFISGCVSQDVQLTPANPPSWAPTYIPTSWNLTSVYKSTDYEYVLNYIDSNENEIEFLLLDNTGYTKEEICEFFQGTYKETLELLTDCENKDGVLVQEFYDSEKKAYIQNIYADPYGVSYYSKIKIDTNELIKITKTMQ